MYLVTGLKPGFDTYRNHQVWVELSNALERLERITNLNSDLEPFRDEALVVLRLAQRSRANVVPYLYDQSLDAMAEQLRNLGEDAGSFEAWWHYHYPELKQLITDLPGPARKGLTEAGIALLDDAAELARKEVSRLGKKIQLLETKLNEAEAKVDRVEERVADSSRVIERDFARVAATAESADKRLEEQISAKLSELDLRVEAKEASTEERLKVQLAALALAANAADKLVERAAVGFTARSWAERASRERRNALWIRAAALAAYALAAILGAFLVLQTLDLDGSAVLTPGAGLLRGLVVASMAGVGAVLTAEQRRHFREADSSEEVSIAIRAIEPFFNNEDAGSKDRTDARRSLADAVFVTNLLSRFSNRDSAKHGSLSVSDIDSLVSEAAARLAKIQDLGR